MWDYEVDIAVIGFGGAGAAAAITAFDAGAKVVILEKNSSGGGKYSIFWGKYPNLFGCGEGSYVY